jgi:ribosomal protein S27AE
MTYRCPGADNIRTPTIKTKICPNCGGEIDLFSSEMQAVCDRCGFVAYNDTKSCLKWCQYARQCVGDELYEQFLRENAQES